MHRDRGDFELVVRLIDLELGIETDKNRRADLYYEKGKLLADELLREDEAVRAFERVLELRPDDEGTPGHARPHLARQRQLAEDRQEVPRRGQGLDGPPADDVALSVGRGDLRQVSARRQRREVPEEGARDRAAQQQGVDAPRAHLSRRAEVGRACRTLRAAHRSRRDEGRARAGVPGARRAAEQEARQANDAAESYKKALGLDPANARALSALVEWYTAEENWQALIRVYENALRARPRGEPETAMYLQIGMLWWKKLGNLEAADEYWKKVRKAEPAHPAMLEFYRALYHERRQRSCSPCSGRRRRSSPTPSGAPSSASRWRSSPRSRRARRRRRSICGRACSSRIRRSPRRSAALKRLYQKTEKWNALLELLKEAVEALPKDDVDGRVAKLVRGGRDLSRQAEPRRDGHQHLQPHPPAQARSRATRWRRWRRSTRRWGAGTTSSACCSGRSTSRRTTKEKSRLLRRIAGLWIDKFSNHNQAVKPLEELYAIDPADPTPSASCATSTASAARGGRCSTSSARSSSGSKKPDEQRARARRDGQARRRSARRRARGDRHLEPRARDGARRCRRRCRCWPGSTSATGAGRRSSRS